MNFVTPVLEICLSCWDRTAKYRLLIKGFRRVLKDLRLEREKLINLSRDVTLRVENDDWERHRKPTHEVTSWLQAVEDINGEVEGILKKGEEVVLKTCLGGHCPTNCRSRYKLAKEAEEVKARVVAALDTGLRLKAEEVTCEPAKNAPMLRSLEPVVGMDSMFYRVWKLVEDERVRSIGLFGVGGVGKTTLMTKIHDHFLKTNPNFKAVLWVVMSQHATADQVQKIIWDKLNFSEEDWNRTEKGVRAMEIQNFLSGRKFVLFLDDLWESVDLAEIGIPHNQPNSKVIFTTRSEDVCIRMGAAKRMRVDCLPPEEAIQLFRKKVGEETWNAHHQIPELAEIVVRECQFLPLALVTIGAAMVSKTDLFDWDELVKVMTTRPAQFEGMKEKVLSRLEFSYDALPDETHRKCFLFCCIFPEDSEMDKDDLIQLWIGEGFFDQYRSICTARYHAKNVFRKLTSSCLLEETLNRYTKTVVYKMHDLMLEMALWVASEHGKATGKILVVKEDKKTIGLNELESWKDAEMVSVVNNGSNFIAEFPTTLRCLNLSTLLLRGAGIDERFPSGFFSSMPSLKVLDLSYNVRLCELPGDIGHLTNLQYLNLVGTAVQKLPEEFKNLVNLRFLFLNKDMNDDGFPEDVLSKIIPSLIVFCNLSWASGFSRKEHSKLLESLQRMEVNKSEVSLTLCVASEVKQLLSSPLVCCLKDLSLELIANITSIGFSKHVLRRMNHLESLSIEGCDSLAEISVVEESSADIIIKELGEEEVVEEQELHFASSCFKLASQDCFRHLLKVHVQKCDELLHLTSLIFYAPNLEVLHLRSCEKMREVVRGDIPENLSATIFSRLTVLKLMALPNLESICRRPLPFSSLKLLEVLQCENLQKLPFCVDNNKLQRLQRIEGQEEWWKKLKWDDVATQQFLTPKFQPYPYIPFIYYPMLPSPIFYQIDASQDASPDTCSVM